ncbi:MAG: hypothetical protein WA740_07505 [Candidatus Binataceae bacterium]
MSGEGGGIFESRALGRLARRHRADGLHLIAKVDGDEREPNRAWIECDRCTAVFELEDRGEWTIVEKEAAVSTIGPECARHVAAAQA